MDGSALTAGSFFGDGRLQNDVMTLKLEIGIKVGVAQHQMVPQFVVWPHGVIRDGIVSKPLGTHF